MNVLSPSISMSPSVFDYLFVRPGHLDAGELQVELLTELEVEFIGRRLDRAVDRRLGGFEMGMSIGCARERDGDDGGDSGGENDVTHGLDFLCAGNVAQPELRW